MLNRNNFHILNNININHINDKNNIIDYYFKYFFTTFSTINSSLIDHS